MLVAALIFVWSGFAPASSLSFGTPNSFCAYYGDPMLIRFDSSSRELIPHQPGFHELFQNAYCPHIGDFRVIALVGSPQGSWHYSPNIVIVEFNNWQIWLTRDTEQFYVHNNVPKPRAESPYQAVDCGQGSLCVNFPFGLMVRMMRTQMAGRIEVYASTMVRVCGKGICERTSGPGGLRPTAGLGGREINKDRISGKEEMNLKQIAGALNIKLSGPTKTRGRPAAAVSPRQTTVFGKRQVARMMQVIRSPSGQFAQCAKATQWNAEKQYKAAMETAAAYGGDVERGLAEAAANCHAALGSDFFVDVRAAMRQKG